MIDKNLIEKSLSLCGREYSDMGIESYCYFLLSPEFIEKYQINRYKGVLLESNYFPMRFGIAIGLYQSGNEEPLISLLEKICKPSI